MDYSTPSGPLNPLLCVSYFIRQHSSRLDFELAARVAGVKRLAIDLFTSGSALRIPGRPWKSPPFASLTAEGRLPSKASDEAQLNSERVAKSLAGTSVYTVSNPNNEFVLMSDSTGLKSIGLLCFRHEDAEAFLAQVQSRKRELRSGSRVVPVSLDQMYMLKVEGIAFRFLPDPVQIKNALELKSSGSVGGFDGVPVYQSDLLVVKKRNRRYCPIFFQKEDIEKELSGVSRASRGRGLSQHIMVGSLEDVLKKMEMTGANSGWEDLVFVPPGKNRSLHIQEVAKP